MPKKLKSTRKKFEIPPGGENLKAERPYPKLQSSELERVHKIILERMAQGI